MGKASRRTAAERIQARQNRATNETTRRAEAADARRKWAEGRAARDAEVARMIDEEGETLAADLGIDIDKLGTILR